MHATTDAIDLLKKLISIPSFSKEEKGTADLIENYLTKKNIPTSRKLNNVWAVNKHFNKSKPSILLNSHHDTVKPATNYTLNPFEPLLVDGKLYGLGSNDAGASLVSLLSTFEHFYNRTDLNFNLIIAATAEEEISGKNGIELILPELGELFLAIVGEPTTMQVAVAEKGLLVIDCVSKGVAGHAARNEGVNAIYAALKDIEWFKNYQFPTSSKTLGAVNMSVTIINAGEQHNVIPSSCTFTVDIRTTDSYSSEEILSLIRENISASVTPRSLRLNPSSISDDHMAVIAAKNCGLVLFGSATLSDQALLHCPSIKIGPGESQRSHTADEFIYINEIKEGITTYIHLLTEINTLL